MERYDGLQLGKITILFNYLNPPPIIPSNLIVLLAPTLHFSFLKDNPMQQ